MKTKATSKKKYAEEVPMKVFRRVMTNVKRTMAARWAAKAPAAEPTRLSLGELRHLLGGLSGVLMCVADTKDLRLVVSEIAASDEFWDKLEATRAILLGAAP